MRTSYLDRSAPREKMRRRDRRIRSDRLRLRARRLNVERLEDRRLLSIAAWSDENMALVEDANNHQALPADVNSNLANPTSKAGAPAFVPGEILVGFENEVPGAYRAKGAAAALKAAGKLVAADGLLNPRVLMHVPAAAGRGARLATHWQLPAGADVLDTVNRLAGRPGIAYAEPNYTGSIDASVTDPRFNELWGLHNTGQTDGVPDADIDAPEVWDIATGSLETVVGVIDTGVDYTHAELYLNIWINQSEIPTTLGLTDVDDDGLVTFYDLNDESNIVNGAVSDLNGTGYIDAGDLLLDPAWADGIDTDGNTFTDDLVGWDWVNNDNDPYDDAGHGTHVSGTIGALANNDEGVAGINWSTQIMG